MPATDAPHEAPTPAFRLSLRGALFLVAAAACGLAVYRLAGAGAVGFWTVVTACLALGLFADGGRSRLGVATFFIVQAGLIATAAAGRSSYYTSGLEGMGYALVALLVLIPALLLAAKHWRAAAVAALAYCALIGWYIPGQLARAYRLQELHREARSIVKFASVSKTQTGSYPPDLSRFRFENPKLRSHVAYGPTADGFRLHYWVDDSNMGYFYDTRDGGRWWFEDD